MPVKFGFRDSEHNHFFAHYMDQMFAVPGESFLLSSGTIQQPPKDSSDYKILDKTNLIDLIEGNCRTITTIGNFPNHYESDGYENFVEELISRLWNKVIVSAHASQVETFWHAKVAMRLQRTHDGGFTPCAALLGSSNLTKHAYGTEPGCWNHEADMLIYTSEVAEYFAVPIQSLPSSETPPGSEIPPLSLYENDPEALGLPQLTMLWDDGDGLDEQEYMEGLFKSLKDGTKDVTPTLKDGVFVWKKD